MSTKNYDLNSVYRHYKNLRFKDQLELSFTIEDKVLEILKVIVNSLVAGIGKRCRRSLKYRASVPVKPIAELCNLSILFRV